MLLEVSYKIVMILLLNGLQPITESLYQEQQYRFRASLGRGFKMLSLILRWLSRREVSMVKKPEFFFLMMKAFNRAQKELLWKVLEKFGVLDKLMRLLNEDVLRTCFH